MIRACLFASSSSLRSTISATLILCFGLASGVRADDGENAPPDVLYRQKLMSIVGANMGAMSDIMKYRMALPGHVEVHAGQMAEMAQLIAPAFKKNVASDRTDAKPEIWKDWTKFEARIDDFEKAARNLAAAANGSDPSAVGPAMKALGKSCGGCHDRFRQPKEKSFRNRSGNDDHDHDDHE